MSASSPKIVISIPHGGLFIPPEINPDHVSENIKEITQDVTDWHTSTLYHFSDLIDCTEVVFPYCQTFVNVNRHPDSIDESAPIVIKGKRVYKSNKQPTIAFRKELIQKYHNTYHQKIRALPKTFILDCHSSVDGDVDKLNNVFTDDITISDWQSTPYEDEQGIKTAPPGYLEAYAAELEKALKGKNIKIGINNVYTGNYGHVMAMHGSSEGLLAKNRCPLLFQETNEKLYMENGFLLVSEVEFLRRAFAKAIVNTVEKMLKPNVKR